MNAPLPAMPATMPVVVFIHPDSENHVRLRGGEYFEILREGGFQVICSGDPDPAVPANRHLLVFASIDGTTATVDFLAGAAQRQGSAVLVDVTGPIWATDELLDNPGVRDYWANPANLAEGERLMRAANGLTTPHQSYVDNLLDYNPNVFVLPDMVHNGEDDHDCEAVATFGRTLMLAWHSSLAMQAAGI